MTKALTETTNCTFRAKKWGGGHPQKIFPGASRRTGAPHFQIRSGATVYKSSLSSSSLNLQCKNNGAVQKVSENEKWSVVISEFGLKDVVSVCVWHSTCWSDRTARHTWLTCARKKFCRLKSSSIHPVHYFYVVGFCKWRKYSNQLSHIERRGVTVSPNTLIWQIRQYITGRLIGENFPIHE